MRRGAALLLMAVLLGACSDDGDGDEAGGVPTEPSSRSPRPTSVVSPTQDAQTSRLQALAQLAEQAAADLPPVRRPAPDLRGPVLGGDISWPQCPKGMGIPERRTLGKPMPLPEARFVVVGLTNGPGFTANPCLADQVAWVRERKLMSAAYAVVSWPADAAVDEYGERGPYDAGSELGALANTGYQQALANVATMRNAGLGSPIVWVDVEPVPDFEWSSDVTANAAVVQGAVRGYADAGYRVGVYSTPYLWEQVVGRLALELPEWRAAGETSRAEATTRCGTDWSIQRGPAVMGQWVEQDRDHDITCPGVGRDLGRWFHQN